MADRLHHRLAWAACSWISDNTWQVDKETGRGPKLEELEILLREVIIEGGEKMVIFSQWLRMKGLIMALPNINDNGHPSIPAQVAVVRVVLGIIGAATRSPGQRPHRGRPFPPDC